METAPSQAIGFRAPADLAAWLKEQAIANRRSVSNQTVWALTQFRLQQQSHGATA